LFLLCSAALGGPLYKYQDENGVVSYTDDPSDKSYKYVRVQSYDSEKKEEAKGSEDRAKTEEQEKESKTSKKLLSSEDAAEKDRMLKKVAELEDIKKNTDNEKYQEMLQSEIDLLKKQLSELDMPKTGKDASREKAP